MNIKTRKYQLTKKIYLQQAFKNLLKSQWWVLLIYVALASCYFWLPNHWWITGASIGILLYVLFWLIQFVGISQLEQGKVLFEKLSYEINSQQILIKLTSKQGMTIKWDKVKRAKAEKGYFVLTLSKVQIIYLPHKIFNSQNEIKFLQTILKRKGY